MRKQRLTLNKVYFCYAIILRDNINNGEIHPAFIVCWDTRVNNNSYVFRLCRSSRVVNPVLTETPLDIYELSALYESYRFSVRIKGKPRKIPIKGVLVALRCNKLCTKYWGPACFISIVNKTGHNPNACLIRWQEAYLDKERKSQRIYGINEVLASEDGIEVSSNYIIPRRKK